MMTTCERCQGTCWVKHKNGKERYCRMCSGSGRVRQTPSDKLDLSDPVLVAYEYGVYVRLSETLPRNRTIAEQCEIWRGHYEAIRELMTAEALEDMQAAYECGYNGD